jgi:hypothetical protein
MTLYSSDMSKAEEVYNAGQAGALLNLGGAMLRRYAATYESLSGSEIQIHRREGRLFTQEQVDTLLKARDLVTTQGLSVRAAMQIALSGELDMPLRRAERRSKPPSRGDAPEDALAQNEAFAEVVKKAVQDGNKELVEEMRLLRASLESNSNSELQFKRIQVKGSPSEHGLFVRFALWVERSVKR